MNGELVFANRDACFCLVFFWDIDGASAETFSIRI